MAKYTNQITFDRSEYARQLIKSVGLEKAKEIWKTRHKGDWGGQTPEKAAKMKVWKNKGR